MMSNSTSPTPFFDFRRADFGLPKSGELGAYDNVCDQFNTARKYKICRIKSKNQPSSTISTS